MTDSPRRLYDTAAVYCEKIQVIIDRLAELGAEAELRLLQKRLQRLSFRSTPREGDDE